MTFTHLDDAGRAHMVDVGGKPTTVRTAVAGGRVSMKPDALQMVIDQAAGRASGLKKGDVLGVAQIAGITAAKRASELIPLCHPLPIDSIEVDLEPQPESSSVQITARVTTASRTGVEMEALTAVSGAALTIYDMCKAVDKAMRIEEVRLLSKTGSTSGDYQADE
ncbi:MAG: cyclic pyranopterin monophosphate synthase MoaC [Chloroflexota bacterium]|nr:cyclic pyranopterin monophosphate synthase MoaC [Chloroflexota bacterium]